MAICIRQMIESTSGLDAWNRFIDECHGTLRDRIQTRLERRGSKVGVGLPGGRQDRPRFSPRGLPGFSIDVDNNLYERMLAWVEIWGAHMPEMPKCAGD